VKVCWQRKTGRNRTAATSPLNHIAEAESMLQFMQAMTSVENSPATVVAASVAAGMLLWDTDVRLV